MICAHCHVHKIDLKRKAELSRLTARAVQSRFAEGIRWNALLQKQGKIFFTGEPCLMSGKYGGNLSGKWAASGKTGADSLNEIGSVLCGSQFSEVERFVTLLFSSALVSSTSVLRVLSQISKDRSDRGFPQFFAIHRDEILVEVFKVLAGQFFSETRRLIIRYRKLMLGMPTAQETNSLCSVTFLCLEIFPMRCGTGPIHSGRSLEPLFVGWSASEPLD